MLTRAPPRHITQHALAGSRSCSSNPRESLIPTIRMMQNDDEEDDYEDEFDDSFDDDDDEEEKQNNIDDDESDDLYDF